MRSIQPLRLDPLPAQPLVTVLIANYNYARFVGRAIESLQGQTYRRWEAWICDDGSADGSREVIAEYAGYDARVRLITQPNQGMAAALNSAYEQSCGDLVALLDSDDEWKPRRLQRVVTRFLEAPAAGMVTHPVCAVRAGLEVLKPLHPRRLDEGWLGPSMLDGFEPGLPPCSGLTFHADVARRVFPLPRRFRQCADKIAQDRAALLAPVAAVREPLALYRLHGANLTGLSGPVTVAELDRKFEFLEQLWEDREQFVLREHGFLPDRRPWRERESAHLNLARTVLEGGTARVDGIEDPARRAVWRLLLALPRPVAAGLLRLWWTENPVKRLVRNAWDQVRPGGLRQYAASP